MTRLAETVDALLVCDQRAQVVAYLDGELTNAEAQQFEQHAKLCSSCAQDLIEQRRLLCALNMAFVRQPAADLPPNFSQLVMARAQSDMGGMRGRNERQRALKICLILGAVSALLLGATAGGLIGVAAEAIKPLHGVAKIACRAVIDTLSGAAVLLRAVGRQVSSDPQSQGLILLIILAVALTLLPCLIISYHRTRSAG